MATIKKEVTTPARKATTKQVSVRVCDLCGKVQKRGMFHRCNRCGRDMCSPCSHCPGSVWSIGRICKTCDKLYNQKYAEALDTAEQGYEETQEKLYKQWKAESLATPNPRSQS